MHLRSAFAAFAFAAIPAASLLAQVQYTADPIEYPSGGFALYPSAINNSGVVTGWWYGSPVTNREPFVYSQAQGYRVIPKPAGYAFSVPMDINDSGAIVGFATSTWSDETNPRGWKFENNQFSLFPTGTKTVGINNAGLMVGAGCVDPTFGSVQCLYTSMQPATIQTFQGVGGYATSMDHPVVVNDLGQLAYRTGATTAFFRDTTGATTPLPTPPAGWTGISVEGINNQGQVIARWTRSTPHPLRYYSRGFVWSAATGAQEFGITGDSVRPKAINNRGQILIESGTHDMAFFDCWLWSPSTGPVNLDEKTDLGGNLILTDLYDINDNGQIVAGGDTITPPADIYVVLNPPLPPGGCGSADFNRDGDVGTDQDIEAFFACLAGNCCTTCGTADFNSDGDVGTDADIEAFFRVLAGGTC